MIHPDTDTRRDYRAIYDASGDPAILNTLIGRLAKGGDVFIAAGGGPDLVSGGLEGIGKGAADTAGATGDEGDGAFVGHALFP